jgi:pilus assembly protein Flp/PilA
MTRFQTLPNVLHDIRGSSSVEYGIILAMIVLAIFLAMQGVASEAVSLWNDVSTKSANAMAGS